MLHSRIVKLHRYDLRQLIAARMAVMEFLMIFVVLAFSVALMLYATPIILYVVPLLLVGLLISYIHDSVRHHRSRAAGH